MKGVLAAGERAAAKRVERLVARLEARADAVLPIDLQARADAHGLVIEGRGAKARGRAMLEEFR